MENKRNYYILSYVKIKRIVTGKNYITFKTLNAEI